MVAEITFDSKGRTLAVGAHVCAMYEGREGVLSTLAETFAVGLRSGERCAYVGPESSADLVREGLHEAGADPASAERDGHLVFVTDRGSMLKGGTEFDPEHLMGVISDLFGATLEEGYAGLRLSADVSWISRNVPGEGRILEFETLADEVVNDPGIPLLAICQYRLSEMEPEDSISILERHPLTLVGAQVHENEDYKG